MPKGSSSKVYRKSERYSKSQGERLRIRTPGQTGGGFRIMKEQKLTVPGVRRAKQTTPEKAVSVTHEHRSSFIKPGSVRDYDTYIGSKTIGKVVGAINKKRWDKIRSRPGGHSTHKKTRSSGIY